MPNLTQNPDGTPHIHSYVRARKPTGEIDYKRYRCDHPDCTHWAYKVDLKGKRGLCTSCKQTEILLDYENLKRARTICFKCAGTKKAKAMQSKTSVLDQLFGEAI